MSPPDMTGPEMTGPGANGPGKTGLGKAGPETVASGNGASPAEMTWRTPRWVRVTLVLSLALNLMLAGLIGGAALLRHGPPGITEGRDLGVIPFLAALPREERRALFLALRDDAGPLRDNRRALQEEARGTLAALRAEPFNAEAFAARLAAQRARVAERVSVGDRALVKRLSEMQPEARAAFADRLEEIFREGDRRFDRRPP